MENMEVMDKEAIVENIVDPEAMEDIVPTGARLLKTGGKYALAGVSAIAVWELGKRGVRWALGKIAKKKTSAKKRDEEENDNSDDPDLDDMDLEDIPEIPDI